MIVADTAADIVLARAADGTTRVLAGKAQQATAAPRQKAPGYRVFLDGGARTGTGCAVRLAYTASDDGRGRLSIGAIVVVRVRSRCPGAGFASIVVRRAGTLRDQAHGEAPRRREDHRGRARR